MVISPIGNAQDERRNIRNVFGPPASSVSIGQTHTSITGRLLGKEAKVRLAADIGDADGDLARRLLNLDPAPRWRALSLVGAVTVSVYGREEHTAEGALTPLLETELGEPVVAVWVSPDGVERRYVVPAETPWTVLLQWLLDEGLPELVPGALRRARRQLGTDMFLMTRSERTARSALAELEVEYSGRKRELECQLEQAEAVASPIRDSLLFGTGQSLVDAVRLVFEFADVAVTDLDQELGDTRNADLLCTYGGRSRLVEVKSASGGAPERAYQDLLRHLREWPNLPGSAPVDGGALVINHEYRKIPKDRARRPFERPEFLAAQTEPVIATLDLFDAWREENWEAVRQLLFGVAAMPTSALMSLAAERESSSLRRGWFRGR